MRDDLKAAVEGLYRAYAHVRLADHVDYCDHCVDPEQVAALRRTPMRQLTPEHLGDLLWHGMSTWGDSRYFRHFLPRLLELVSAGEMEDRSYPIFLPGRLRQCWAEGTPGERRVGAEFLEAWWLTTISSWPGRCKPRDVLETIDGAGRNVVPYLDAWTLQPGEVSARHLAALVEDWMVSVQTDDRFCAVIDRWLRGSRPSTLLTTALASTSDPAVAEQLRNAEESLVWYRSWREADEKASLADRDCRDASAG